SVNSDELRQITDGGAGVGQVTFSAGAARAVIHNLPTDSAGDLVLIDVESGSATRLTDYNQGFFEEHPAARVEKFSIHRAGYEIESRLLFPTDFDPALQYPLVLDIHGGPHGVFADSFNTIQQVMTASGYLVLAVNPRGSSTYGVDFMKAVHRDWGGEDYLDIMAALDEVCGRDYVDSSRLGITGYSYGGFMSSWIIGHDTRFKAAVVGAPCTNLSSMYGTSDIGVRFGELHWGGVRKDALDAFMEHSPLTYAPNVETPVLLLHGEADLRVPMEQSEQYFVTLKRLGKVVEFVRFPGGYHGFVRGGHPRMREEYLSRLIAWMDKHVGSKATVAATPEPEAVPADD
ncbi:MAG: S9 family peptidase, partial [Chloroflexi bacterium]|nr:S9 family peptidase [Chloroflexota bacterium]